MIIKCKNCLRKFNLNEKLLKPDGSKVRCTRCENIFLAFPISLDSNGNQLLRENEMNAKDKSNDKTETPSIDQRMHHRIKVSVPASCISTDAQGNSIDFNIGRITDVSQEGLSIEIFCNSSFEFISISFIALDDKEVQIKGKVVHVKKNAGGKMKIGLSLIGTSKEIANFVSQVVRYHHYATKPVDGIQKTGKAPYPLNV